MSTSGHLSEPPLFYIRAQGGVISELSRCYVGGMVMEISADFFHDITEAVIDL